MSSFCLFSFVSMTTALHLLLFAKSLKFGKLLKTLLQILKKTINIIKVSQVVQEYPFPINTQFRNILYIRVNQGVQKSYFTEEMAS